MKKLAGLMIITSPLWILAIISLEAFTWCVLFVAFMLFFTTLVVTTTRIGWKLLTDKKP